MRPKKKKGEPEKSTAAAIADAEEGDDTETKRFYGCYLLVSLNPRHKGHTYIGFTVNPRRRIRQHNGELTSGAWRTKRWRPWEMVLCIYGFPTNVSALQFEWAWQHPHESLAVRQAAANFKSLSGVANKIKMAYTMLTLPAWQSLNITVNYFSTKYSKHYAACPSLPGHMKIQMRSMDELPCYNEEASSCSIDNEDELEDFREFDEVGNAESQKESTVDEDLTISKNPSKEVDNNQEHEQQFFVATPEFEILDFCSYRDEAEEVHESPEAQTDRFEFDPSMQNQYTDLTEPDEILDFCSYRDEAEEVHESPEAQKDRFEFDPSTQNQYTDLTEPDEEHEEAAPPREIEIIDLLSPSPCCRSNTGKRRKVSSVNQKVIDLTRSPMFIQL